MCGIPTWTIVSRADDTAVTPAECRGILPNSSGWELVNHMELCHLSTDVLSEFSINPQLTTPTPRRLTTL